MFLKKSCNWTFYVNIFMCSHDLILYVMKKKKKKKNE